LDPTTRREASAESETLDPKPKAEGPLASDEVNWAIFSSTGALMRIAVAPLALFSPQGPPALAHRSTAPEGALVELENPVTSTSPVWEQERDVGAPIGVEGVPR